MNSRFYCNRVLQGQLSRKCVAHLRGCAGAVFLFGCVLAYALPANASGNAPQWMHALVNAPVPAHDEKTDAVLLYSETNVTVVSADKIRTVVRKAYKILRPEGRDRGTVVVTINSSEKLNSLQGWCIPAQGKDYAVNGKDGVEASLPKVDGGELIDDVRARIVEIPAADPGNIVGWEYELDEHPLVLQDEWRFQRTDPVRESRYSLQLPAGWEFKAAWLNSPEVKPTRAGNGVVEWVIDDIKAIRKEDDMPPLTGVAGQMVISFIPPAGPSLSGFSNWKQMGEWYLRLTSGRRDASPEIKQQVAALTASASTQAEKMRAIAAFVQRDIRYVAIELGIGGLQPHSAAETFTHRYGDCKDKATLMSSMLHEIGVDSYYVVINDERGSVSADTPAFIGAFNHAILAIKLPESAGNAFQLATIQHPRLGKLLFFDPTNNLVPIGQLPGYLQANYGLLVTPDGGELIELPEQPVSSNGIQRTAKLTLDATGRLQGEVEETRLGDQASYERWALRNVTKNSERIKPIETLLASSLANFRITKATARNIQQNDLPFGFDYSFVAEGYAQNAGNLLLLRPRVLGSKARGLLETREPRRFPIEFDGPVRDTDRFEITLPPGYEVDDLPPPVDVDFGFASYHSKTEVKGNVIGYTRTFEIKELSVPVNKAEQLKKFYRIIASDERNTAVLKLSQ